MKQGGTGAADGVQKRAGEGDGFLRRQLSDSDMRSRRCSEQHAGGHGGKAVNQIESARQMKEAIRFEE